jgi:energy-coupling factor transporter ATP-binding protein EcfA2
MTRIGRHGVAQVEIAGVVATAYDHYDSRAGDPQLHTHVVIANRAQGLRDGRWRTLDSRALHAAVVGLSEHYNAVLSDRLAGVLGVAWERRERGRNRNPEWEIAGVPEELIVHFSSRTRDIDEEAERLIEQYTEGHGRQPSRVQVIRLRQRATLSTRPEKKVRSLAELTEQWRNRASAILRTNVTDWAREVIRTSTTEPLLRADDIPSAEIRKLADTVLLAVGERRSTWRRWNLHAEAVRTSKHLRFASPEDREAVTHLIVDAAEDASTRLTPPELASTPPEFLRADESSAFRPRASVLYSSQNILTAEDHLLDLSDTDTAPRLGTDGLRGFLARPNRRGLVLAEDQAQAIEQIVTSGRIVDVLVGPAGSGKTTTLGALRRAWERRYGRGSIVGLAPSAAAAEVLAGDLDIRTENTTKWLYEHDAGHWRLHRNQLLIVDEASLSGTLALDRLASHAADVGAKLVLVGDWAQLSAVDASGAFGMLVRDRGAPPELWDIRRFHEGWEKEASLSIRIGDPDILPTYQEHDRIAEGTQDTMMGDAYQAWQRDRTAGKTTILIAHSTELVSALNQRARLDLILDGTVAPGGVQLHDGNETSRGDTVITRLNARTLRLGASWVKNGDRWSVTETHEDGSLSVRRADSHGRATIRLPAEYVAANVELGYAVTAHRAQGATVDTAHAIVTGHGMTREVLYVAMTRGRDGNQVYVATDQAELEEHQFPLDDPDAITVLSRILARSGAELSARESTAAEQDEYTSIHRLAAEYDTLAQTGQAQRWTLLLENSGLPDAVVDSVIQSDVFGALAAALRRAEANGYNPETLLPAVVAQRRLDGVDDPAKVLHYRISEATARPGNRNRSSMARLIAGLIPEALGPMPDAIQTALTERADLIEHRARALAEAALTTRARWMTTLGTPPAEPTARELWILNAETVTAYRDKYQVVSPSEPLGREPHDSTDPIERVERQRAADAVRRAQNWAGRPDPADHRTADIAPLETRTIGL